MKGLLEKLVETDFSDQFKPASEEEVKKRYEENRASALSSSVNKVEHDEWVVCDVCEREIGVGEKYLEVPVQSGFDDVVLCPECVEYLWSEVRKSNESMITESEFSDQFKPLSREEAAQRRIVGMIRSAPSDRRSCHVCGKRIAKGERHIRTHEEYGYYNICRDCIIQLAQEMKESRMSKSTITESEFRDIFQPADKGELVGKRGWPELNAKRSEVTLIKNYEEAQRFSKIPEHKFQSYYGQGMNFYGVKDRENGRTYIILVSLQGKMTVLDAEGEDIKYFMERKAS